MGFSFGDSATNIDREGGGKIPKEEDQRGMAREKHDALATRNGG